MTDRRYKETDADRGVKRRLWDATERELLHFASRYREEAAVGQKRSDAQDEVARAAKDRGCPMGLVRFLGAKKRGVEMDGAGLRAIRDYRTDIGLHEDGRT